jgi:hypothetical protein
MKKIKNIIKSNKRNISKMTNQFIPIMQNNPTKGDILMKSHQYLIKAGFIHQVKISFIIIEFKWCLHYFTSWFKSY